MKKRILFFALTVLLPLAGLAKEKRPNILFAFADDWGKYASAYAKVEGRPSANTVVKTPTFDRIADNGVLFKHAFVTAPSCTPCRSSLLSAPFSACKGKAIRYSMQNGRRHGRKLTKR